VKVQEHFFVLQCNFFGKRFRVYQPHFPPLQAENEIRRHQQEVEAVQREAEQMQHALLVSACGMALMLHLLLKASPCAN